MLTNNIYIDTAILTTLLSPFILIPLFRDKSPKKPSMKLTKHKKTVVNNGGIDNTILKNLQELKDAGISAEIDRDGTIKIAS